MSHFWTVILLLSQFLLEVSGNEQLSATAANGNTVRQLSAVSMTKTTTSTKLEDGALSHHGNHDIKPVVIHQGQHLTSFYYRPDINFTEIHLLEREEVDALIPIFYHYIIIDNPEVPSITYLSWVSALASHPLATVFVHANRNLVGRYFKSMENHPRFYFIVRNDITRKVGAGGNVLHDRHLVYHEMLLLAQEVGGIFMAGDALVLRDPRTLRHTHTCVVNKSLSQESIGPGIFLSTPGCSYINAEVSLYEKIYKNSSLTYAQTLPNASPQEQISKNFVEAYLGGYGESSANRMLRGDISYDELLRNNEFITETGLFEYGHQYVEQSKRLDLTRLKTLRNTLGNLVRHFLH